MHLVCRFGLCCIILILAGCRPTPAPTSTRTPEPPSPTPAPTSTRTPEPPSPTPAPTSTRTPEPLVPTLPPPTPTATGQAAPTPTLTPTPTATSAAPAPTRSPDQAQARARFGIGVAAGEISDYPVETLGLGWYLNWRVEVDPARPGGVEFWQMVRVSEAGYQPGAAAIRAAAQANPGSIWLIGNEPDVIWQDNVTPERYAGLYGELYHLLKAADPTCRVAIGGVSQPTPLRMAYLDRILDAYRAAYGAPLPVDVWNVHNFILREERDSWGVSIPPGLDAETGILYEIDDNDNMEAFKAQLVAFRRWMAERGYRERPLVVSEYGIPMPEDYGFGPARVQAFLYATFDYMFSAADAEIGYPADGNRLVQWWCWYSLADTVYPTGNLFDPSSKALTPLGRAWAQYQAPNP